MNVILSSTRHRHTVATRIFICSRCSCIFSTSSLRTSERASRSSGRVWFFAPPLLPPPPKSSAKLQVAKIRRYVSHASNKATILTKLCLQLPLHYVSRHASQGLSASWPTTALMARSLMLQKPGPSDGSAAGSFTRPNTSCGEKLVIERKSSQTPGITYFIDQVSAIETFLLDIETGSGVADS